MGLRRFRFFFLVSLFWDLQVASKSSVKTLNGFWENFKWLNSRLCLGYVWKAEKTRKIAEGRTQLDILVENSHSHRYTFVEQRYIMTCSLNFISNVMTTFFVFWWYTELYKYIHIRAQLSCVTLTNLCKRKKCYVTQKLKYLSFFYRFQLP